MAVRYCFVAQTSQDSLDFIRALHHQGYFPEWKTGEELDDSIKREFGKALSCVRDRTYTYNIKLDDGRFILVFIIDGFRLNRLCYTNASSGNTVYVLHDGKTKPKKLSFDIRRPVLERVICELRGEALPSNPSPFYTIGEIPPGEEELVRAVLYQEVSTFSKRLAGISPTYVAQVVDLAY